MRTVADLISAFTEDRKRLGHCARNYVLLIRAIEEH